MWRGVLLTFIAVFSVSLPACVDVGSTQKPAPIPGEPDDSLNCEPGEGDALFFVEDSLRCAARDGELNARAVTASGLLNALLERGRDEPYTLFRIQSLTDPPNSDTALKNYLTSQGLTEEAFLSHPRLRAFMNTLVVPEEIDFRPLINNPGSRFTRTSLAEKQIVFRSAEDAEHRTNKGFFANESPIATSCSKQIEFATTPNAKRCTTERPFDIDFKW